MLASTTMAGVKKKSIGLFLTWDNGKMFILVITMILNGTVITSKTPYDTLEECQSQGNIFQWFAENDPQIEDAKWECRKKSDWNA